MRRWLLLGLALAALAMLPAALAFWQAGRIGCTGGEAMHLLPGGAQETALPELSDLPDPAASVPAELLRIAGGSLVTLRRIQAVCLALVIALISATALLCGLPEGLVVALTGLLAGQFFLIAAFSLALVRFGLASVLLAAAALLVALARAQCAGTRWIRSHRDAGGWLLHGSAAILLAGSILLAPPLLLLLPASLRGSGLVRIRLRGMLGVVGLLALGVMLIPRLNRAAFDRILFGVSGGSLAPFLGFDFSAVLGWLSDGPRAVGSGLVFLAAASAMPARLISGLLGTDSGWANPLLVALSAMLYLHPPVLLAWHRLAGLPAGLSGGASRYETLTALLAGAVAYLFCFADAHGVVVLAIVLPAPLLLSALLLIRDLVGAAGVRAADVSPRGRGSLIAAAAAWGALLVLEVAQGVGIALNPPPAMSLSVQEQVVGSVSHLSPSPGCHRHEGEETAAMFALLAPPASVAAPSEHPPGRPAKCRVQVVTTELAGTGPATCPVDAVPIPATGRPGFCLAVTESLRGTVRP